jgi:hypothetical protein
MGKKALGFLIIPGSVIGWKLTRQDQRVNGGYHGDPVRHAALGEHPMAHIKYPAKLL